MQGTRRTIELDVRVQAQHIEASNYNGALLRACGVDIRSAVCARACAICAMRAAGGFAVCVPTRMALHASSTITTLRPCPATP